MRLFYAAAGKADIIAAHTYIARGEDHPGEVSLTFSGMIERFCQERGARALMISPMCDGRTLEDGSIRFEHAFKRAAHGARYHIEQVRYGLFLLRRARAFKADVALIDIGCTHFFMLLLFRMCRIKVIPMLHNTLWPAGFPPRGAVARLVLALDRLFWRWGPAAIIGVSPECVRQVETVAPRAAYSRLVTWAQFDRTYFDRIAPPPHHAQRPFTLLFVARAEENKGLLDLVAMAASIERRQAGLARWVVCGDGPALPAFRAMVAEAGLGDAFVIAGWTPPEALIERYAHAHAAIVPTRSDFAEGMAMTALQAIAAGRPLVTNSVVPALEVLAPACLAAGPDDPESHADAVFRLATDEALYRRLQVACEGLAAPLYDRGRGLTAVLHEATRGL